MEALRHSLLAPSAVSFLMVMGCTEAMLAMIHSRYAAKDDNGKPILAHPYKPWEKVDPKYKDMADAAYRGFKMCENVKEWTFMSLPLIWTCALYGDAIPRVTENFKDGLLVASGVVYLIGNHKFITGYMESADGRIGGFRLRTKVVQFWLVGAGVSLLCGGLQRFGLIA